MRALATMLFLPLLAGSALAAERAATGLEKAPGRSPGGADAMPATDRTCRDRIATIRAQRGLPPIELRDGDARPEQADALLFYAVDREIDGCDVLVMADDPRDVHPLPSFAAEDWRFRPAWVRKGR